MIDAAREARYSPEIVGLGGLLDRTVRACDAALELAYDVAASRGWRASWRVLTWGPPTRNAGGTGRFLACGD